MVNTHAQGINDVSHEAVNTTISTRVTSTCTYTDQNISLTLSLCSTHIYLISHCMEQSVPYITSYCFSVRRTKAPLSIFWTNIYMTRQMCAGYNLQANCDTVATVSSLSIANKYCKICYGAEQFLEGDESRCKAKLQGTVIFLFVFKQVGLL